MKLAVIAGDGIGPEVIGEALKVLDAVLPGVEKTEYDLGARRYHATGEVLPDSVLDELQGHDAILLGAIGDPSVPSGVLERGLLLTYAVRTRPSHQSAAGPAVSGGRAARWPETRTIDFVVVREGTEGPYTGTGGAIRVGTPHEIATEVSVNTAFGVRAGRARTRSAGAAAAQAPDPGAQDQRADLRGRAVVAHRRRRSAPSIPTSRSPISTSTPRPSTWSPTRAGST